MKEKLKKVMSQVFNLPIEEITEDTSPDNIEKWDSLNHMNLILAIEQAFDVSFEPDEIIDMLNYKLIVHTLKTKGIN